jgi:hypothetical protein
VTNFGRKSPNPFFTESVGCKNSKENSMKGATGPKDIRNIATSHKGKGMLLPSLQILLSVNRKKQTRHLAKTYKSQMNRDVFICTGLYTDQSFSVWPT